MDRREFLKATGGTLLFGAACAYGMQALVPFREKNILPGDPSERVKRGMVVDLTRCVEGCTACVDECRRENNVAFHGDPRFDIHWIRKLEVRRTGAAGTKPEEVLLLCQHCENPPCAQVCPVQATYPREDGVVIVDHHRCIGCRYCMVACPYAVRFFNYKENPDWPNEKRPRRSHGVAESCTLCVHRLDAGREPACVEACRREGHHALEIGDLNDPTTGVAKAVARGGVARLREDLGTEPKVYYRGL